jgi:prolyl 4-hydroxylase
MFYLDDPIAGGATVFPEIRARVEPKRKSAVFWYNLKTSGERDFRTWNVG